ncbi:uncharacterized protein [Glycine max]|uniref:uncharacterized protein n=1 Tax=Glycine max TaxID=3847 RepID=UPI0003DEA5FF|nr:uncharacterized protein LOC102667305 [Glycine max]|eukprot:XP_006601557.1 uncharacterized protein LOC102667305 [Glycine max]
MVGIGYFSCSDQKSTESAIKNLEVQVGQLAKQLADRSSSSFTANTEKNPKEECKAVMTRSRMAIQRDDSEAGKKMEEHKQQLAPKPALEPVSDFVELEEINEETEDDKEEKTPIKMPLYAKFLKDMLTKKNRYIHSDRIVVEGNCSVVIQRIVPPKHKDLGVVTRLCSIGEVVVGKDLIDLGASINLMPLSMCRRLEELEIMPTRMTLQLADRSITRSYGVIEDVLVKMKHLIFPADFIVRHRRGCRYSSHSWSPIHVYCKLRSRYGKEDVTNGHRISKNHL